MNEAKTTKVFAFTFTTLRGDEFNIHISDIDETLDGDALKAAAQSIIDAGVFTPDGSALSECIAIEKVITTKTGYME